MDLLQVSEGYSLGVTSFAWGLVSCGEILIFTRKFCSGVFGKVEPFAIISFVGFYI